MELVSTYLVILLFEGWTRDTRRAGVCWNTRHSRRKRPWRTAGQQQQDLVVTYTRETLHQSLFLFQYYTESFAHVDTQPLYPQK